MNVGLWDKDRSSEGGMLERVAEGTPPMRVPRDSREEELLICSSEYHPVRIEAKPQFSKETFSIIES